MKLLLTSGGVTNASIRDALVELLGKPIEDAAALCIPTAQWGHPMCDPTSARGFVTGLPPWGGMTSMAWKSLGLLELTALPTIGAERWVPWVREADVLLVDGGDATYLCHWMRASGLADLLPSLPDTTWVGRERREHGDDPADRRLLRGVAVGAGRPHPGHRRLRDLPAPGRLPDEHARRGRALGGRHRHPGRTSWTTRPPSGSSTARSTSSPRGPGSCSAGSLDGPGPGGGDRPVVHSALVVVAVAVKSCHC